jgi:hypothetical protein
MRAASTYQWDDTGWVLLVLLVLSKVEQTLASLVGPRGSVMTVSLSVLEEVAEPAGGDGLITEPEEGLLMTEQVPGALLA